jgi:hypothetical protein
MKNEKYVPTFESFITMKSDEKEEDYINEAVFAETQVGWGAHIAYKKIEVGMYVNIPSEWDSSRASNVRLKVIEIKNNNKYPYLRTVRLENGSKYLGNELSYPSFDKGVSGKHSGFVGFS